MLYKIYVNSVKAFEVPKPSLSKHAILIGSSINISTGLTTAANLIRITLSRYSSSISNNFC